MSVIITPAAASATTRPTQDPQRVVRPLSHRDSDTDATVLHWRSLVDRGPMPVLSSVDGGGNPPAPPEVIAQRAANDALFRGIAADRRRLIAQRRA